MSQEIVCKECQYANTPGSKFCNNCGAKLPLGTHIFCGNCGSKNSTDRIFCDSCGTRLIPDAPKPEEKPKDEQPSSKSAFSLPVRRPGETGDLDPRKVPDWLKTGKTEEPVDDDNEEMELPRLEELTRKKQTDDLPEWLVDDEDSDPIIHAPTIISTEFYRDMMGKSAPAEPRTDDIFAEEDADLPDWLKDVGTGTLPPISSLPATKSSSAEKEGLTDWLSEPSEKPAPKPVPKPTLGTEESLTGWLTDGADEDNDWFEAAKSDKDRLTEWLTADAQKPVVEEAGSVQESLTNWLSDLPDEDEPEAQWPIVDEPDSAGLTEWLLPGEEKPVVEVASSEQTLADSLTDWLSDLPEEEADLSWSSERESEADRLTAWFEMDDKEPTSSTASASQTAADSLTGWLAGSPDENETDEIENEWAVIDENGSGEQSSGGLSSWLSETAEEEVISEPGPDENEWGLSSRLTSWLAEQDSEIMESTAVSEPAPSSSIPDESRLTNWLADMPEEEAFSTEDDLFASEPELAAESDFDEAARLVAWFGGGQSTAKEEAEANEDHFDWLDEPEKPIIASAEEELPSDLGWLNESEEELASIFQSQPTIEAELPDWLANVASSGDTLIPITGTADANDLEAIFQTERDAAATEIDFLRETGSLQLNDETLKKLGLDRAKDDLSDDFTSDLIMSDEPDWLAALDAMGVEEPVLPGGDDEPFTAVPQPFFAEDDLLAEPANMVESDDWQLDDWETGDFASGDFAQMEDENEDELPAWISQLDATGPLPDQVEEEESFPSEDMPDWIASLRPSQGMGDSGLSGTMRGNVPETLAGVPEELAGAELPDWLQNIPRESNDMPGILVSADTQLSDIPDWLQAGMSLDTEGSDLFDGPGGTLDMTPASDEWSAILNDLPPAVPLKEILPRAEIPEWVMQLKPVELTGGDAKAAPSGPEETFGPLSGLRGVIAIEPVIALPRVANPLEQFTVSPEQRQQVTILRQLMQAEAGAETAVARKTSQDITGWIRLLFALILIIVIALGLRGVVPVELPPGMETPALSGIHTAVNEAAGKNVLVAFEYTPAMAGELTPEAQTLLAELAANDSTVFTLSQYTSGVPLAAQLTDEAGLTAVNLGYLPGGAIGLRWLGECLDESANCDKIFGTPFSANQQSELENIALIIVLTADRQNLVNWIEQVGTPSEQPVVAGVTQALAPSAAPYFAAHQLAGVLNGIPGTAVYQQEYLTDTPTADVQKLFSAQVSAQMLLIVVMLLGALIYILSGIITQRRHKS